MTADDVARIERSLDRMHERLISLTTLVEVLVHGRNVEQENLAQAKAALEAAAEEEEPNDDAVRAFTDRLDEIWGDAWVPPQRGEETPQ